MVKTSKLKSSNIYGHCLKNQYGPDAKNLPWCNINSVCAVAKQTGAKLDSSIWNCNSNMTNDQYGAKLTDSQWEDPNWGCCEENHTPKDLNSKTNNWPSCKNGASYENIQPHCLAKGNCSNLKSCHNYIKCPEGYVCNAVQLTGKCRYKCVKLDNSCPKNQVLGSDISQLTGSTYEICKGGDIHHGSSHEEHHGSSHEEPPNPLGNKFCYYKGLCTINYPSTFKCKKYDNNF